MGPLLVTLSVSANKWEEQCVYGVLISHKVQTPCLDCTILHRGAVTGCAVTCLDVGITELMSFWVSPKLV